MTILDVCKAAKEIKDKLSSLKSPEDSIIKHVSRADCCLPVKECPEPCCEVSLSDISYLHSRIESLWNEVFRVWNALYSHQSEGHLPKINGAEKLQKALDVLGLSGDYEIEKKTIYASSGKEESSWLTISPKSEK